MNNKHRRTGDVNRDLQCKIIAGLLVIAFIIII